MPGSLRVAPRPRAHARALTYPALGIAAVFTGCASQAPLMAYRGSDPEHGPAARAEPSPVMLLATDPAPGPGPRQTHPAPKPVRPAHMEFIEDPAARRAIPSCAGDCPSTFNAGGPAANIRFRVEAGHLPDARAVLSAVQPALHACVARLASRPTWIQVRASVSPEGRMAPIEVRSDADADSELVTCVANATLGARFGRAWHATSLLVIVDVNPG